jgi:hypothetical protein
MDLARGPLFRTALLRLGFDKHVLLVVLHHIIGDGWTVGILIDEVATLFNAFRAGEPSPLPEPALQYADFACWQHRHFTADALRPHAEYWQRQLAGMPTVSPLPTDRPRPATPSLRGAAEYLTVEPDLLEAVRALGGERSATLFMTLFAVFAVLLYRFSGQTDVVVGSPIAGRNREELESMLGFFVNTLVLRVELSGEPTFAEVLDRVRTVSLDVHAHQDLPFEQIVQLVRPDRALGHSPLYQVVFALQNAPYGSLDLSGLSVSQRRLDSFAAKFDIVFSLEEDGTGLSGVLEYATDLFDTPSMAAMVQAYIGILRAVVANPLVPVVDIPIGSSDRSPAEIEAVPADEEFNF